MRAKRSQEAETKFVETLKLLHDARRSSFTSQRLNTLSSFLPSAIEEALQLERFSELNVLQQFDPKTCVVDTHGKEKAVSILVRLKTIGGLSADVFSFDNTNTIEGFFTTVKSRIPSKTSTLLDIYKAITFTENVALATNHPASPLPPSSSLTALPP